MVLRACRQTIYRSVCLSVCLFVRKVYCGKTADWIRMPFGVVSGTGLGMGILDFGGDRRRGRDSLRGEFGASHCNQWGLCDALFSKYFADLLLVIYSSRLRSI